MHIAPAPSPQGSRDQDTPEQIESLHELGFVERRENVIFLGPPGVGKTHLAISLAIAAAQSGRRVYYGTLADLITSPSITTDAYPVTSGQSKLCFSLMA